MYCEEQTAEAFKMRAPGNTKMTSGTLPQVLRAGHLEEDYHNLNAVQEAKMWTQIRTPGIVLSSSGSLGMGSLGIIAK